MIFVGLERLLVQGRIWIQDGYFKIKEIAGTTFTSEPTGTTTPEADHIYVYVKDKSGTATPYWKDDGGTEHEFGDAASAAPVGADYLVKTANATLTAERVVTDTASITVDWSTAGQAKFQREALTGDVTASQNSNATTIANDAVTNAKLANMAAWTYKIRNASSTGDPSDAAVADFTTAVPVSGDFAVGFNAAGDIKKFDVANFGSSSGGGGHLHGLTRLLGDGSTTAFNLTDFAEYITRVTNAGSETDPSTYTLSSDRDQVTFDAAPTLNNVLVFEYVIAGL